MSRTDERTTTGDHAEQAFKHRARDALDLADLRFNGLQHASMLRGVEVRGSSGPRASRAPSVLRRRGGNGLRTAAHPGPTKEYGR